ncbi:MAG TPA: hypothetical protein VHB99_04170, partial [Pirellulales bacterium]|nr:hypothetical protein [Pirellulales bacterium]
FERKELICRMFRELPQLRASAMISIAFLLCLFCLWLAPPTIAAALPPDGNRLAFATPDSLATPPGVEVEYTPLEDRLFRKAKDGRLDGRWLLAIGLAAGGERDVSRIERALGDLEAWERQIRREVGAAGIRPQAEAVLEFLHAHVLRGEYRSDASDLSLALSGGDYNCVGATALFYCLAESCGLPVSAAETPGHVCAFVGESDDAFIVETTCRDWLRVATGRQANRRSTQTRKFSAAGLAALFYYNAGADLLGEQRFAEALAANIKALRLDPANLAARSNFLAGLNNWALECHGHGDFVRAVRLLEHGMQTAPEHRPFRVNYVAVHQRWIESLVENERYESALDCLATARRAAPEEGYFESAALEIQRRFLPPVEPLDR